VIATARPGAEAGFVTEISGGQVDLVADGGRLASTLGFTGAGLPARDLTFLPMMAHPDAATLDRLAADAASGQIRVPVTATYSLEQAGQAFADFGSGALGKLAITLP
jgi:NADPH:quinone reductase-like Zn-dependent oxidoreductase